VGEVVQMTTEGFFQSLVGLDAADALDRCRVRADEWRDDLRHLREKLDMTPRGDKQGAHEIKQAILRIEGRLKRMRPVMATYSGQLATQEAQYLWAAAVREVCGQDALREVYAWMRAERKRRQQAGTQEADE